MEAYVLSLLLTLAPRTPVTHLAPFADAIASVAETREDAALLAAVAFYENSLRINRGVPFGITCCNRAGQSLTDAARIALRVIRYAQRDCGHAHARVFARYVLNRCTPTAHSERRALTARRLLAAF